MLIFSYYIPTAINACIASPCRNGGQCIDTVGDYICQCQKQGSVYYTGKRCDEGAQFAKEPFNKQLSMCDIP